MNLHTVPGMRRIAAAISLLMLLSGCASTHLSAQRIAQNVAAFDVVWETVRDTHWDPDLNGVDWDAARAQYRPRVQAARTMPVARAAMRDMLNLLGQSHFRILAGNFVLKQPQTAASPSAEATAEQASVTVSGALGFQVRVFGDQALVTRVPPGLPAAEAGVRLGWELVAVNDQIVAACLKRVSGAQADATERLVSERSFAANRLLKANVGERVDLTFETPEGVRMIRELQAVEPPGHLASFGYITPVHVQFEARRIAEGHVGYVRFNVFLDPESIMPAFEQAIGDFADCDGVILDLRGNPGGIGAMAMGMAGFFLSERGSSLGSMQLRESTLDFVVLPRPRSYAGRLAILIDELSASTAEILAGGLQDLGRARLFGRRTAGAVLPSQIRDLPNGDRLQYAVANYLRSDGRALEKLGVTPDQVVIPTRAQLAAGKDPVLEAAQAWILGGPMLSLAVQ